MLERVQSVLKAALLALGCVALVALTVLLIDLDSTAVMVRAESQVATSDAHLFVAGILANVTGVRQHADRVLTEAGLTAVEARKESKFFNDNSPTLLTKVNKILDDFDVTVGNAGTAMTTLNTQAQTIGPFFSASTMLVNHANSFVSDRELGVNAKVIVANVGKMTTSGAKMLDTAQRWEDAHAFPEKKRGLLNEIKYPFQVGRWVLETWYYARSR